MPKRCLRCTIYGRVQGVFFRANTQKKARELGITGWVRNLPAGEVEVLICGSDLALQSMQKWLAVGPALANVTAVTVKDSEIDISTGFEIIQ